MMTAKLSLCSFERLEIAAGARRMAGELTQTNARQHIRSLVRKMLTEEGDYVWVSAHELVATCEAYEILGEPREPSMRHAWLMLKGNMDVLVNREAVSREVWRAMR